MITLHGHAKVSQGGTSPLSALRDAARPLPCLECEHGIWRF